MIVITNGFGISIADDGGTCICIDIFSSNLEPILCKIPNRFPETQEWRERGNLDLSDSKVLCTLIEQILLSLFSFNIDWIEFLQMMR